MRKFILIGMLLVLGCNKDPYLELGGPIPPMHGEVIAKYPITNTYPPIDTVTNEGIIKAHSQESISYNVKIKTSTNHNLTTSIPKAAYDEIELGQHIDLTAIVSSSYNE